MESYKRRQPLLPAAPPSFIGTYNDVAFRLFNPITVTYNDVVCNPITGENAILPKVKKYRKSTSFLGFDPFGKQFKVLAEGYPFCHERDHHKILTLGTGKLKWRRKNSCPWSEEFKLIDTKGFCDQYTTDLINYKGKLGGISWKYAKAGTGKRTLELHMWVLEDVEKQEWSNHDYTLSDEKIVDEEVFVAGVTSTGEIVLSMRESRKPFYVFYFSPERNSLQSVEIQGFGEHLGKVKKVFVDHVEDITLNIMNTSLPDRKRKATSASTSSESHLQQDGPEQKRKPNSISTSSKAAHM
ncbi:unnamed protein product [Microthlaspi erraticum]|uniref:F-box associated beta-propeller type 3 domain-containing protein n=1 Tax=Microthlaspi erraticum TaxID=1685480 RepID=A0A6D2L9E2_9BRAS|nr:unnamed protein product [Microthlaspi erraticum]